MAQAGFTPLRLYSSITAAAVPTAGNLVQGELAINTNDGKLFYEDSSGVVQVLATKDAASGVFTNISYSGTLTGGTGVVNLGSGQFYKDASGNVGIGTASPTNKLSVVGGRTNLTANNETFSLGVQYGTGAGLYYIGGTNSATPDLVFSQVGGLERMRLTNAGDLGIGTASPSTKLDVQGTGTIVARARSLDTTGGAVGSVAAEFAGGSALSIRAGANYTFLVSTGATDPLLFGTNSSEKMRIDSSGNVGIGNTADNNTRRLQFTTVNGGSSAIESVTNGLTDQSLVFKTTFSTESEKMRITGTGNVGIGTSTPTFRLQVAGTQRIQKDGAGYEAAMLSFSTTTETGAVYRFGMESGGSFIIGRSDTSTTNITLDSSGNVGIGTNTPATYGKLAVQANNIAIAARSGSTSYCEIAVQSGTTDAVRGQFQAIESGIDKVIVGSRSNHPVAFTTFDTERMRIDTSGNVGIGTSSPTAKLDVFGNGSTVLQVSGSPGGFHGGQISQLNTAAGVPTPQKSLRVSDIGEWQVVNSAYNAICMTLTDAGAANKGDNSSTWTVISDARLKQNIRPITNALGKICALNPCHFEYITRPGKTKTNFIAQEFETVFPGHVSETSPGMEFRSMFPAGEKIKSIDADMIPYLVAAIKELKAELNLLKGN